MNKYYITREAGVIVRLTRWPTVDAQGDPLPIQERLSEDHPDVAAFRTRPEPPNLYNEMLDALDEVAAGLPPGERTQLDALLEKRNP